MTEIQAIGIILLAAGLPVLIVAAWRVRARIHRHWAARELKKGNKTYHDWRRGNKT